eukprot:CAMPEP_0206239832 /NCGR_PEP_ID=MMETSP0047_2-20121206/15603_1 /ASSEMBLY_ACC=CAM_ASM_000192 /TAXON_ID=195065 /ORGANISM="Chroomonas mesostigmatica_cf, Strain CCMP1168" /LENGTH=135 /DNA_ID=CAMNT_0053664549 /DNA_START=99 /DNA_END=506 /DNA_ORIENTATION=+
MAAAPPPSSCDCFGIPPSASKHKTNESKNFFANERTFMHWIHMSVVMGSIATGLVAFARREKDPAHMEVVQGMATLLIMVAVLFVVYATSIFVWRRKVIAMRGGNGEDTVGPLFLAGCLGICLIIIFFQGVVRVK